MVLDENTVEKLAALEHWRWCRELQALGWRYADVRDDFLKRKYGVEKTATAFAAIARDMWTRQVPVPELQEAIAFCRCLAREELS